MANGSFYNYVYGSNTSNYFGLYCEYAFSQNISGNYTDVTVDTWIRYYSIEVGARSGGVISVNGNSKSFSTNAITNYPSGGGGITKLTQQTIRVTHDSDGTKKNVNISVSWPAQINYNGTYYGTLTASTTVDLPTIPRASSIGSISGNTIGSSITININRYSSLFTHYVYYSFGSVADSCISTNAETSCSFTPPMSLLAQIPNSTSGTGMIRVDTYNGSTKIGTASKTITLHVPSDVVPTVGTITLDPIDINGNNVLVQGKNRLTASVSGCSAGLGSTIKSYIFSGPGISYTGTNASTTSNGAISESGTLTYTVTVIDNRGRAASKTATITCYAYKAPRFTSFNAYRVVSESSTEENDSGTFIRCVYGATYSSVNNTNDITITFYYKKGSGNWASAAVISDSEAASGNAVFGSAAIDSTYSVYAKITDNYSGASESRKITVLSTSRVFNARADGTGFAFGKMAETPNLLDVAWPIKTGGLYVQTKPVLLHDSSGATGNVSLSDSAANYEYLEIYYSDTNNADAQSIRVIAPNNKNIDLSCTGAVGSQKLTIISSKYIIEGNQLTFKRSTHVTLSNGATPTITDTTTGNNIKVLRVLGYN